MKRAVFIITDGGCKGDGVERLMMKKMKSRKDYVCDNCGEMINKGEDYFHLQMSPSRYSQLIESFDGEEQPIIKRAHVRCVDRELGETEVVYEGKREVPIFETIVLPLVLPEARA